MLPLSQPPLIKRAGGIYHCVDIRALYHWLEAHGYHYCGSFGPDEYGRFAHSERAVGEASRACSIEVRIDGAYLS